MMPDLDTLIERLESATEGSRELDRAIEEWRLDPYDEAPFHLRDESIPHYTTSLDAALTLVPEHCSYTVRGHVGKNARRGKRFSGAVSRELTYATGKVWFHGTAIIGQWTADAKSPAFAMCIAALRARDAAPPKDPTPLRKTTNLHERQEPMPPSEREIKLEGALRRAETFCAEHHHDYDQELSVCKICKAVDVNVPGHEPDCPFAALAKEKAP